MKAWALALLREATQTSVLFPDSLMAFHSLRAMVAVPVSCTDRGGIDPNWAGWWEHQVRHNSTLFLKISSFYGGQADQGS